MTSKIQALIAAHIAAVFGFVAWLVALPPELQTGILGQVVSICPPSWQPAVGFYAKGFATLAGVWGLYKASKSGPQSPPKNPAN